MWNCAGKTILKQRLWKKAEMGFKELLKEALKNKLKPEELGLLPSGFQAIGNIIILNLNKKLKKHKKEIAQEILKIFPRIKTICNKKAGIKGKFRKPSIEILAGKNTEAITKENNCLYKFDVKKLMFAKGNINERIRIAKQAKPHEIVVDMFAGIGYFTILLAKSVARKIYSIELNPEAFKYLKENLKLNKIENKVEAINTDCKKEIAKLKKRGVKADRIVMGYLPPPRQYIPDAIKIAKKNTIIHYETLLREDNENNKQEDIEKDMSMIKKQAEKCGFKARLLQAARVKNYKPHVAHYTLDVQLG